MCWFRKKKAVPQQEEVRCIVCGTRLQTAGLWDPETLDGADLDFRPATMQRGGAPFAVQQCPCCKYSGVYLFVEPAAGKEYIRSWEYENCEGNTFKSDLASRFYRSGVVDAKANLYKQAYKNFLYAAWVCDDIADEVGALACRVRAVQVFDEIPAAERSVLEDVRHVDVLRRAKRFKQARKLCKQIKPEEKKLQDVLRLQLDLIKAEDSAAHTVAECKTAEKSK